MAKVLVDARAVDGLIEDVAEQQRELGGKSRDAKVKDTIIAVLGKLGAQTVQDDSLIYKGQKFILPVQYEGRLDEAITFLQDQKKQQEHRFEFGRTFKYRPWDGAHAFMETLKSVSGTTGFGVTKYSFFGPILPHFESIAISATETAQVPWGAVAFPPFEAEFHVGGVNDKELGILFRLNVEAPRKWRRHIEAMFTLIEERLKTHSIYRGKAINGAEWPEFLNLTVDPNRVVYSEEVLTQLGANLWTPLVHTDLCRELGLPLKRAVLLEGPFGSGKTLAGMITANKAVENGWTFVQCRPGKDDPAVVLKTAQLYAPAVVWIEDIEVHASEGSAADISRLLEMLDGVTNKGVPIVAGFTTNHIERIQKGALRPGRIDAIIRIDGIDESALRKLVTVNVPAGSLADDIDYARLLKVVDGWQPAFVVEAIGRALRFTVHRTGGSMGLISTDDLVHAAESLRGQLDQMNGAKAGASTPTLDGLLTQRVEDVLGRTSIDGESFSVEPATALNGAGTH